MDSAAHIGPIWAHSSLHQHPSRCRRRPAAFLKAHFFQAATPRPLGRPANGSRAPPAYFKPRPPPFRSSAFSSSCDAGSPGSSTLETHSFPKQFLKSLNYCKMP